jgi:flagellin-like hook-associated protein FlgL
MESVLSSMTAIVESAMSTSSTDSDTRAALGKKFNDLLVQMSTLAGDSAYGGTNLLSGQDLTVQMGENYNGSTYTVDGFYVAGLTQHESDANGEVSNIASSGIPGSWGTTGAQTATNFAFALNLVENPTAVIGIKSFGTVAATYDITGASVDAGAYSTFTAAGAGGSYYVNVYENTSGVNGYKIDWTDSSTYTGTLSSILDEIESAKSVLETRDSLFAYDSSTITLRESYTNDFISTLQDGADSLTLADENEESANLLSLQTSQSLAVQAMSMSNTQMQNVLRLLQS